MSTELPESSRASSSLGRSRLGDCERVIDGQPISNVDAMGYYITVAFAGHDTTASSLAGVLRQMLPRIRALELNGTPTRTVTNFVGGPKSVPIRFSV